MEPFEQLQELQLPLKDAFYSSLTAEEINHFYMTDLEDYHNFYLLTDVLLLANVFENFRDVYLQHYGLDPAHNYTSPGLSWRAALNMMDVELDLLTDIDQHLFIEEGIRRGGGGEMISHQYTQANVPGLEITTPENEIAT